MVHVNTAKYRAKRNYHDKLIRKSLVVLLGAKCSRQWCNCTDISKLEVDHKMGAGTVERKSRFKNSALLMYQYYLLRPDEAKDRLQVLCHEHNDEKRLWNEEHRWKNYYKLEDHKLFIEY